MWRALCWPYGWAQKHFQYLHVKGKNSGSDKRIDSPGSMHDTGCLGLVLWDDPRDGTGREAGGGFRMGNTCIPVADSCWCMAKPIQYCKVINLQLKLINLVFKKIFKGLDMIVRVLKNYGWRFVTLYRRQWSRPSPRTRKAKWLSEEALQITEKRREAKGKGERERYTHLNTDFQRIARRDKKAIVSEQCKEIEGNNRMVKTRDLIKKIRDTKGTFQAKWAQ